MKNAKWVFLTLVLSFSSISFGYEARMYTSYLCNSSNNSTLYYFGNIHFSGGAKTEYLKVVKGEENKLKLPCIGHTTADEHDGQSDVYAQFDICQTNIKFTADSDRPTQFTAIVSNSLGRELDRLKCTTFPKPFITYNHL